MKARGTGPNFWDPPEAAVAPSSPPTAKPHPFALDSVETIGARIQALTDRAIREGRHAPISTWRTVCDGCREWVRAIYHVTIDHKNLCDACAKRMGVRVPHLEGADRGQGQQGSQAGRAEVAGRP